MHVARPPQRFSREERHMRGAQARARETEGWGERNGWVIRFALGGDGRLLAIERSEYMAPGREPAAESEVRSRAKATEAALVAAYARTRAAHELAAKALLRRDPHATIFPWYVSQADEMVAPAERPRTLAAGPRARGAGRPAARRSSISRDDGDDGPKPPPALGLAPPPRAIFSFGSLPPEARGEHGPPDRVAVLEAERVELLDWIADLERIVAKDTGALVLLGVVS